MLTRRDFIKTMSLLSGAVLAPVRWLGKWAGMQPAQVEEPPVEGELYAGFVLLPEGAELPSIVKEPDLGMPIMCGVGAGIGGPEPTAVTTNFLNVTDILTKIDFPLFIINNLPNNVRPAGGHILSHDTGEVFGVYLGFEVLNHEIGRWEPLIYIWSQPYFHQPFPLWAKESKDIDDPAIILEKASFLPSPGIMSKIPLGFIFYWIQRNVFYTLVIESAPGFEACVKLLNSLEVVK